MWIKVKQKAQLTPNIPIWEDSTEKLPFNDVKSVTLFIIRLETENVKSDTKQCGYKLGHGMPDAFTTIYELFFWSDATQQSKG